MTNTEQDFEKKVLETLRSLGFQITGYYPYDSRSEIIGFIKPAPPLTTPVKTLATVIKGDLTVNKIESLHKIANDSNISKCIIFSPNNNTEISDESRMSISKYNMDLLTRDKIESITCTDTFDSGFSALEVISPTHLIDSLPDFATQKIPMNIVKLIGNDIPAWKIFEQAVYAAFKDGLGYHTRQLGNKTLFEKQPEGIAIRESALPKDRYGVVYECKSSSSKYLMTAQDELSYIEYINEKKSELNNIHKVDLKYFIIVSPDFSGDTELRRDNIFKKTNVLLVYMKASTLKLLTCWTQKISDNQIRLQVDLNEIFSINQDVVQDSKVLEYMKTFDSKFKSRY